MNEECGKQKLFLFNQQAENEAASSNEVETAKTRCQRGDHDLILNEEYGLYCTVCSYMKSIKDIDPPFVSNDFYVFLYVDYQLNCLCDVLCIEMSVSRVGNYLLKDVYCTLFVMDLNYIHELNAY